MGCVFSLFFSLDYWYFSSTCHIFLNLTFLSDFLYCFSICSFGFFYHLRQFDSYVAPLKFNYQKEEFSFVKSNVGLISWFYARFLSLLDSSAHASFCHIFIASFWTLKLFKLPCLKIIVIAFGFLKSFLIFFKKKSSKAFFTSFLAIFLSPYFAD